ncbi:MAG: iron-sulfur cluster assembly scaffold protein [Pseudomonadota bacterium]
MSRDPYNTEVRQRFAAPAFAGRADTASRGRGQGVDIEFSASCDDQRIASMRFRAYGCPHTIAACDLACEQLEGQPLAALASFSSDGLMRTLSVPVEKTGRILVLEDALRDLNSRLESP